MSLGSASELTSTVVQPHGVAVAMDRKVAVGLEEKVMTQEGVCVVPTWSGSRSI